MWVPVVSGDVRVAIARSGVTEQYRVDGTLSIKCGALYFSSRLAVSYSSQLQVKFFPRSCLFVSCLGAGGVSEFVDIVLLC